MPNPTPSNLCPHCGLKTTVTVDKYGTAVFTGCGGAHISKDTTGVKVEFNGRCPVVRLK